MLMGRAAGGTINRRGPTAGIALPDGPDAVGVGNESEGAVCSQRDSLSKGMALNRDVYRIFKRLASWSRQENESMRGEADERVEIIIMGGTVNDNKAKYPVARPA